ncbi:MAG: iron complex outermembrane receptor protein [Porticoccaceae bacterium]|jgi:iron complex outermembrane receptor protein
MNENIKLRRVAYSLFASVLTFTSMPVFSQEESGAVLEEVVVTGSRIKRKVQQNSATPISIIGSDEFKISGAKDARDIIALLPINAGSENNADLLTQNFTAGTANVNLRGLGVSSTLVLLNGRRQVLSATQTNDGSSFVDIASLVPALAVERVEVLKDGASAIYGSDAVAGVFNMITRDNFEGSEFQIEYREKVGDGDQTDINVDGVIGGVFGENDTGHFLAAVSYLDRTLLTGSELGFLDPGNNSSGFGNPATFRLADGSVQPDPQCEEFGGFFNPGSAFCRRDFGPHLTYVPQEERLQLFTRATWDWSDNTKVWGELGYTRNDIQRAVSTTSPVLIPTVIPVDNPGNPFGQEANFLGRAYWPGFEDSPEDNFFLQTTTRVAFGAEGRINDNLSWDANFVSAQNDVQLNLRDVVVTRFQDALEGFGGPNCVRGVGVAGVGECQFFNPFANNFNAPVGSARANDPALRDFLVAEALGIGESTLNAFEFNLTGQLFELAAGPVGFALGVQRREEELSYVYDGLSNNNAFGFIIGGQDFDGDIDVTGVYGEVVVPVSDSLELNAALRYEDYGGAIGNTTDPKVSFLWTPTNNVSLRGSYSTSFRAPTVFQTQGVQTTFQNIRDSNGSATFAGIRTFGDENLIPETSTAFNLGVSWLPTDNLKVDLDYWDFSFEDVLSRVNAQGIVDANPLDSRVVRSSAGTVVLVNTEFFNANAIDTSGLDFSIAYTHDTNIGTFTPKLDGTIIDSYDLTGPNGVTIDGVGSRNARNFGNSTPDFRANFTLGWAQERQSAFMAVRHITSYEDDQTDAPVDSFTSIDAQYSYSLGEFLREGSDSTLTIGVVNLADEEPPVIAIAGNYDSKIHDPRGRRVYVKFGTKF